MTRQERKDWLLKQIAVLDNDAIIDEVYTLLEAASNNNAYVFTDEENERLNKAKTSVEQGNFKTNDQVKKEVASWLHSL